MQEAGVTRFLEVGPGRVLSGLIRRIAPEVEVHALDDPSAPGRLVITGLGVVSPVGNDKETAWRNLVAGVSGLAEITRFDVSQYEHKVGGEVKDFDAAEWMDFKAARRSDRAVHFAVAVAKQALTDSGLSYLDYDWTLNDTERSP